LKVMRVQGRCCEKGKDEMALDEKIVKIMFSS
jgi:hypothetical protein